MTFHQTTNTRQLRWFTFFYFNNCWNRNLGPTGDCYLDWNNLGVKVVVAETRPRLAANIIFTTLLVSLLSVNYWFLRLWFGHFTSATKISYWQISIFWRVPS